MAKFKKFINEAYYNDNVPAPEPDSENETMPQVKYDLVLFSGDFDPITRGEYQRVVEFVKEFIPKNNHLFSEKVELGLICNDVDSLEENQIKENTYNLLIKEKQFLTTKLFGLKLYPIDFSGINEIIKLMDTPQEEQELNETVNDLTENFKENFLTDNALVVIRPKDSINLIEKIANLSAGQINIGAMVYPEKSYEMPRTLSKLPMNGKVIKMIALMDHFRPNPEDIRTFCYKYDLKEGIEEAKRLHFKTNNENYLQAFRYLFPELKTTLNDDSVNEANAKVVLEMLKKMYLKRDLT